MDQLNKFVTELLTKPRFEEDFVDKLNCRITGIILLAFSLTLSLKEYVGKPIQCWVPAQFTSGWEQYVEHYCFVENTYWLPLERHIPESLDEREARKISYYQWVPFVLAVMALMFNFPSILWRSLNWIAGINVRSAISMVSQPKDWKQQTIDDTVTMVAAHIRDGIRIQPSISRTSNPVGWIFRWGCTAHSFFITTLYLIVKLLYVGNLVIQFFILGWFIGSKSTFWGATVLKDLIQGREWQENGHFPRVTMCDFQVRQLGNLHRWSVQCVLMINMFNEKIFIFLWWWILVVFVFTVMSFFYWLIVSIVPGLRKEFIMRMLNAQGLPDVASDDHRQVDKFISRAVKTDGVFVLRLMARNAGEQMTSRVVATMFENFLVDDKENREANGLHPSVALFNKDKEFGDEKLPPPVDL